MIKYVFYFGLLAVLVSCYPPRQNIKMELSLDWQFTEAGKEQWYPARVPGSVQHDLLKNGLMPDPFMGTNEDSVQWVEQRNWTYKSNLEISGELMSYDHLELVFKGLDTYAMVYLNDFLLLTGENMFLEYRVDIENLVNPGNNELRIEFISPVEEAKAVLSKLPYELPSSENVDTRVSPLIRKAAYQFGWDFAPRIVTMGIWRPAQLTAWNEAKLERIDYLPKHISDSLAIYEAVVHIYADQGGDYKLQVNNEEYPVTLSAGPNVLRQNITIKDPILWWPNGMGDPYLYDFTVGISQNGLLLDTDTSAIGIREIVLLQEKDSIGTSFRFLINKQPVFIKGANWSPLSSYPGSVPDSVYRNRLSQVKAANMNMLRVWGGGIYEYDLFYDLCDRNGILVWQDFMFANTMNPPTEEFYNLVEQEVRYQVGRLVNHPSLALFNGNNEIEVAWNNWGWQQQYGYSARDSTALWQFYLSVFDELIPGILSEVDPGLNYSRSSPLSNWGSRENFNHSSMHYWGVWHGKDGFEAYKENVGRFVSEYGFQSFPDLEPFGSRADFQSFDADNDKLLHQKSYIGTKLISERSEYYFGPAENSKEFVSKSQQTQALAYKIAIEAHRLSDKCDGTLFWQLNDVWPGPSWSVIDFQGHPKIAYQVVQDRYKPTIIISLLEEDDLKIYVINDNEDLAEAELTLELIDYLGKRHWLTNKKLRLKGAGKQLVYHSHRQKILDGFTGNEVALKITLTAADFIEDVEYQYFTLPKDYLGSFDLVGD